MTEAQRPLILVNYKVYTEATGENAVRLTKALEEAARGARAEVAVAVQAVDLWRVAQATTLPVWAQHVDALKPGAGTGWITAEAVKAAGARGTLLNHAEHRLELAALDDTLHRLKHAGLARVVCTNNVCTTRAAAALGPEYVAIEPPELIGGDISVTTADPQIVADAVKATKETNPRVRVLCGAGVKTGEDLRAALKLGADGVLLASGVVKAKDPGAALRDLLSGLV
ncbi:MAG TPA: triose-phosphate isomerase [Candidatus Thermoplasmatota archaeon]|nr:triose-phosphate isomerase [Candidatus Thermoplasmatota archaeon]